MLALNPLTILSLLVSQIWWRVIKTIKLSNHWVFTRHCMKLLAFTTSLNLTSALYERYIRSILQVRKLKFRQWWNPFSSCSCEGIKPDCEPRSLLCLGPLLNDHIIGVNVSREEHSSQPPNRIPELRPHLSLPWPRMIQRTLQRLGFGKLFHF